MNTYGSAACAAISVVPFSAVFLSAGSRDSINRIVFCAGLRVQLNVRTYFTNAKKYKRNDNVGISGEWTLDGEGGRETEILQNPISRIRASRAKPIDRFSLCVSRDYAKEREKMSRSLATMVEFTVNIAVDSLCTLLGIKKCFVIDI